jgi:hypothetical protein
MKILLNKQKISTKKYPFLKELELYNKKKIESECFYPLDLDIELESEIETFFKERNLKIALEKNFKIKSPCFIKTVFETMIKQDSDCIIVNTNYYLIFDILSKLFLDQEKPNHSLFLQAIKKREIMAQAITLFPQRIRAVGFFKANFTDTQIMELLESPLNFITIKDMFTMYFQNDQHFNNLLKGVSFKDKNTILKIHNIFAKENAYLKSKDFALKQEILNPKIIEVCSSEFKSGWSFANPENYHTLIAWGQDLGHCIGSRSYAESALLGSSVLLGVYFKGELKFTLEVLNGRFNQIQGKSGTKPDVELLSKIIQVLTKNGIIKK